MTVRRVRRRSPTVASTLHTFTCDGCGTRHRLRTWDGPPPGWRRLRAGAEQADLCAACVAIGVWIDEPGAARIELDVTRYVGRCAS